MNFSYRRLSVDFDKKLQEWDGFGFNYVQAAQSRDYSSDPQEYGGFSLLKEEDRQTILEMVFGEDGLQPGVLKMFLDPFHQAQSGGPFDHRSTASWMTDFIKEGVKRSRQRGVDPQTLITLYGPPAWATRQNLLRGRDLNPACRRAVAEYMIEWARCLRQEEGINVRYISLHNEGEDWVRWPADGTDNQDHYNHDYNLYWPPEQVTDFLHLLPDLLAQAGLAEIGVTPGETSNWFRFAEWGYADAIAADELALRNLGLITSHGFAGGNCAGDWNRWFADWRSVGIDVLRAKRPELHAWVTSTSWAMMDVDFVNQLRQSIYAAKVNAIIPWAGIQVQGKWVGGDPNPGTAFRVFPDGSYAVLPGYYFYKQACRSGQPGMAVVQVLSNETLIQLMAFSGNGTQHSDALVVLNLSDEEMQVAIEVKGAHTHEFKAFETAEGIHYQSKGSIRLQDTILQDVLKARSVTSYYAQDQA